MEMTEEQEIKIPVAADFVLPDLDAVVPGTRAIDRGLLELSATYWDTDQLALLGAQLGLRYRSAAGETGRWTLKAGARHVGLAVSREETDFAGPSDQPPEEALAMVRESVGAVALRPVASLVTIRHTIDLVTGDTRSAEVADDVVSVRLEERTIQTFREVEVELFDADAALIDAVMALLHGAGASEPDSTPKYVRALRALGHEV
jgi:inorganic triphosphatase YgiF